jgi:hypothetical protein
VTKSPDTNKEGKHKKESQYQLISIQNRCIHLKCNGKSWIGTLSELMDSHEIYHKIPEDQLKALRQLYKHFSKIS